jgi:hypothetical protein
MLEIILRPVAGGAVVVSEHTALGGRVREGESRVINEQRTMTEKEDEDGERDRDMRLGESRQGRETE